MRTMVSTFMYFFRLVEGRLDYDQIRMGTGPRQVVSCLCTKPAGLLPVASSQNTKRLSAIPSSQHP